MIIETNFPDELDPCFISALAPLSVVNYPIIEGKWPLKALVAVCHELTSRDSQNVRAVHHEGSVEENETKLKAADA